MEQGGESTRLVCVCGVLRVCACAHSHGGITPQHPVKPTQVSTWLGGNQIPGFPLGFSHHQGSVTQWEPTSAEASKSISFMVTSQALS